MTEMQRQKASDEIAHELFSTRLFCNAKSVALFIPMQTEVNTWTIIKRAWEMKMRVFAPVVQKNNTLQFREFTSETELIANSMGLREPLNGKITHLGDIDLVLTPLVAFDSSCNRIGMGGGYYDRAFSSLANHESASKPTLVGLAFDCQQIDKISPNPWDIRLSHIFTELTVY